MEDTKVKVAVVGTGMAGLVTAFLLQNDPNNRYQVELFEVGSKSSLDSASVSISNPVTGQIERIDLPMRAFAPGFYSNLKAMYDWIGVEYVPQLFSFEFSRLILPEQTTRDDAYYIHSSNQHSIPPLKPEAANWLTYLLRTAYLLICYTWLSLCCFFIEPLPANSHRECETLGEYLVRTRLPQHFVKWYILPLFAAVTTCPLEELLQFPAVDLVNYKRRTHGAPHLTVKDGVNQVQQKLSENLHIRYHSRVVEVVPHDSGVELCWQDAKDAASGPTFQLMYDQVVLAVSPDVVGKVFGRLIHQISLVPAITVESFVHSNGTYRKKAQNDISEKEGSIAAQKIFLRTSTEHPARTESCHVQPSGVLVTTCPISRIPAEDIIQRSTFRRAIRNGRSRQMVNNIFNTQSITSDYHKQEKEQKTWRNGDDGVWLVGGWCWDGLVLLEGCIVSAMRVADGLGVEVPWRNVKEDYDTRSGVQRQDILKAA